MLLLLIWWALPVGFSVCFICIGTLRGIQYLKVEKMAEDEFPHIPFVLVSMGIVTFYIVAFLSYESIKNSTQNNFLSNSRPSISYEIPKEQRERLRIYPTLVQ